MGLTLAERRAVTEATAIRYTLASKRGKSRILDELCANTGWHRNHARKALRSALQPKIVTVRSVRPLKYGPDVIAALTVCWTVLGMPAGKRLAPMLGELVAVLRHFGELVIDEDTAELLVSMSAATIDRRLASERAKYRLKGRPCTKPGSLLKSQIPVRTWADWDDARPGFVEIDLVGHDGGNPAGPHAFTLTVTDIATGWTENRSVPSKEAKCVLAALNDIAAKMPFPILGVDSDNGSEFINVTLLRWCTRREITFTRARPGQHERRLSRRAEELAGGSHRGRLPPLRHRHRVVVTQRDLAAAVQADQLLLPAAETGIQDPPRRQGVQDTRQGSHPVPPRDRSPKHDRGAHRGADPDLLPDQSRRHLTPDPSPDRSTPHHHHKQGRTHHQSPSQQARTIT